jgi:hypothetical protein
MLASTCTTRKARSACSPQCVRLVLAPAPIPPKQPGSRWGGAPAFAWGYLEGGGGDLGYAGAITQRSLVQIQPPQPKSNQGLRLRAVTPWSSLVADRLRIVARFSRRPPEQHRRRVLRLAVWQETVGAAEAQEWAVVVPSTGIVQNAPRSSPSGRIIDRPAGRIRSARSGGARPTSCGATRQWPGARFTPSRHFCHTRVRTPAWAVGARVLDAPVVGCDLRVADRAPVAPFRRVGV